MPISVRVIVFLLVAVLFLCPPCNAAPDKVPSAADDIISKALARAKNVIWQELAKKYTYLEEVKTEKLNDDLSVKETENKTYQIILINGSSYPRLIARNGAPLTEEERRKEQLREERFKKALAKKRGRLSDSEEVIVNDELVGKYSFSMLSQDTVDQRPAFVLNFKPKGKDLPIKKSIDRVLNNLAGRVWIDEQDYDLVRVEAKLMEEVTVGWGILGSLYNFDFSFEQTRTEEGVWVPKKIDSYINGRKIFSRIHQRQIAIMKDHKK